MRLVMFILDFLILLAIGSIIYISYMKGKDDAPKGGEKK